MDQNESVTFQNNITKNMPRYMNPTIVNIRKHEDQYQNGVVQPGQLCRSSSKKAGVGVDLSSSRIGEDSKSAWKPTAVRDRSLEQSNQERVNRGSPMKSYDLNSVNNVKHDYATGSFSI